MLEIIIDYAIKMEVSGLVEMENVVSNHIMMSISPNLLLVIFWSDNLYWHYAVKVTFAMTFVKK